jgi:hypothetical protein
LKNLIKIIFLTNGLLLVYFGELKSQQNLVPNPSFESYTTCPNDVGQLNYTTNWYSPTLGTSDFFDTCFTFIQPGSGVDVPQNAMGYQNALSNGGGYSAIFLFYQTGLYREYLQTKLTTTLTNTVKYFVNFYVSLADSSRLATDDIGAFLSSNPIGSGNVATLNYTPQISNPQGQLLNNKLIWVRVSGSFISNGSEQYITIGNFKNDINTDTTRLLPNCMDPDYNSAYYYIDGVCVSTDSLFGIIPESIFEHQLTDGDLIVYDESTKSVSVKCKIPSHLKIYDGFGNLVMSALIVGNESVPVSNFSSGIYVVWLNSSRKKILIN